jgi:DNA-binding transcriptional ArsR family regulator
MEESSYLVSLRYSLWHMLAGTRGGITRARIIQLLRDRPYNTNQLKEMLGLDYKTVQHHTKALTESGIITCSDPKKYGSMFFLSPILEKNTGMLDEITDKIGKSKLSKKEKPKE